MWQWKWLLIAHGSPKLYSIKTQSQVTCLLSTSSFTHLPGWRKSEKKRHGTEESGWHRVIPPGSHLFPPRAIWATITTPKYGGDSLHYSVDPFCTATNPQTYLLNGEGMPSPLQPQQGERGQVTATWQGETVLGKRILIFPLQPSALKRDRVTKWGLEQIYLPQSRQLPSFWNGVATKRYYIHKWDIFAK